MFYLTSTKWMNEPVCNQTQDLSLKWYSSGSKLPYYNEHETQHFGIRENKIMKKNIILILGKTLPG
jgi:hypothetical protein